MKKRFITWNELNKIGKRNQSYFLAELMIDSGINVKIQGWDKTSAFFYLPTKYHREPKPFGMKVSIDKKVEDITLEYLADYIENY